MNTLPPAGKSLKGIIRVASHFKDIDFDALDQDVYDEVEKALAAIESILHSFLDYTVGN